MKKKVIRLTENDFVNVISNSVRKIIKESMVDYNQIEGNLQDAINGLYENGTSTQYISSESDGIVNFEIQGVSGIYYDVEVAIDFNCDYTPSTYYDDEVYDTNEEILSLKIGYYDDYNQFNEIEYVKDEEFESTLLNYIEVDYSDYCEDNHYQYPDEDR